MNENIQNIIDELMENGTVTITDTSRQTVSDTYAEVLDNITEGVSICCGAISEDVATSTYSLRVDLTNKED
jgi:hypothetical protein